MKKATIFPGACAFMAAVAALTITVTGCANYDAPSAMSDGGDGGGSMARFAIVGDWLYTVNQNQLTVVSLKNPATPLGGTPRNVGTNIETIFPMGSTLFIGSMNGMYIYDISKPESPERLSLTSHFRSCDPVVAYGDLAFVTLNSSSGWWCGPSGNELHVYDITDLEYPKFLSSDTENLTSPKGLAVDGEQKLVFVCDSGGVKAFSFADPRDITPVYSSIHTEKVGRIDAYDCKILAPGRLLVVGSDGLFQLDYDPDPEKGFTFVSKINLKKDE